MFEHHRETIEKMKQLFEPDPQNLGLIIGGSVAKQRARADSDVDFILVVTEETFERQMAASNIHYYSTEFSNYNGGYVDGKLMSLSFLKTMAEKGSEPARAALKHHLIVFSKIPELGALVKQIGQYPKHEKSKKIKSFYSQLEGLKWFIGEAQKRNDRFLLNTTVADFVLFAGRLILAYNEILFPSVKWFTYELERAPLKPEGFVELLNELLETPGFELAEKIQRQLDEFSDWEKPETGWVSQFIFENEWRWYSDRPPLHEC